MSTASKALRALADVVAALATGAPPLERVALLAAAAGLTALAGEVDSPGNPDAAPYLAVWRAKLEPLHAIGGPGGDGDAGEPEIVREVMEAPVSGEELRAVAPVGVDPAAIVDRLD